MTSPTTTTDRVIWTLMEANCNVAEIAAYYHVTPTVAKCWMIRAKRWAYREAANG